MSACQSALLGHKRPGRRRTSLPVVRQVPVSVSEIERTRITGIAGRLLESEPGLSRTDVFGPNVGPGLTDCPALIIGDQHEIGLKSVSAPQPLEHRMALLGRRGDMLVVERGADAFLHHLDGLFDDGGCSALVIGEVAGPTGIVPQRCLGDSSLLDRLARAATAAGGLQLISHIGTGWTWALAGEIARRSGVRVSVASAPPRLVRLVNDKIWFVARVREVLGREALPLSYATFGPAAIVGRLKFLARTADRLVVKVPDGAGGEGNVALEAEAVRKMTVSSLHRTLLATLRSRGWSGQYPLLVGVWDGGVLHSPSVQLWIPDPQEGDPVVEGIFEQRITGRDGTFIGAVPAVGHPELSAQLADEAVRLAVLFQNLGYFGRCSFDALVIDTADGAVIHWIECNGRWGGVSIPLSMKNRLPGLVASAGFVIVQDDVYPLADGGMAGALERLRDLLLEPGGGEGVVPLSSEIFERGRGVHLAAFSFDQQGAEDIARRAVARLAADGG